MSKLFTRFAGWCAWAFGHPLAFILACLATVIWAVSGPIFNYSDTWQLVIDAAAPIKKLDASPKLSILLNGPDSFEGRKLGALVTDGVDIETVRALFSALEAEGAVMEIVAPNVGGVEASDGTWIEAKQMIDGGPSELYDAVAILTSEEGATLLGNHPGCAASLHRGLLPNA